MYWNLVKETIGRTEGGISTWIKSTIYRDKSGSSTEYYDGQTLTLRTPSIVSLTGHWVVLEGFGVSDVDCLKQLYSKLTV